MMGNVVNLCLTSSYHFSIRIAFTNSKIKELFLHEYIKKQLHTAIVWLSLFVLHATVFA